MTKLINKLNFIFKKTKKIYLIESKKDQEFVIDSLDDEKYIALDTEFSWRNTYFPKLALLQISSESRILLIDCLKFKELNFLKKILEKKDKVVVMHSSRSDTTVLSTSLNIRLENTFDIQIAEKYIKGGEIKNYGDIVFDYFGYKLDKSETNSNWLNRPLSDDQLEYAADDVNFLIHICKIQKKKLKKINKEKEVIFESVKDSRLGNQELHVSRLKKLKKASKEEKKIFLWREKQASLKNIPTAYIFKDKFLKEIVRATKNKKISFEEISKLFSDHSSVKDFVEYLKQ